MRMLAKQIVGLPVYTERDVHVGSVESIELDIDSHAVVAYVVLPTTGVQVVIDKLLNKHESLRVSTQQVLSISAKRMVVKSTAIPSEDSSVSEMKLVEDQPAPTI